MTILSYAQNFEDVLLWRVLKGVRYGRYVDVGAGHPVHHSVTKLFYDKGWSGVNVEAVPELAARLAAARPRDLTVSAAATSAAADSIELTIVDTWDELSTVSPSRAAQLADENRATTTVAVPARRLDDILDGLGDDTIHFLKVDVEGAELDVISSLDLARFRPWVVVVEVVSGGQASTLRGDLHDLLASHAYHRVYFDGLNDFYLADEHESELGEHFGTPVNVTDDFVLASQGDDVAVTRFAEVLGMPLPAQPSEVLQRVTAVLHDRISFERSALSLQGERDTLREEDEALRAELAALSRTIEGLEQTAYERDRLIATYAMDVRDARSRADREHAHAATLAREVVDLGSQAAGMRTQLEALTRSTSWRVTLPIRVLRRPRTYVARLLKR